MRIGILTGGGDVPGLNPAIKAVVDRATAKGHDVVGLRRGWAGLLYANPEDPESLAEYSQPLDPAWVRTIDRSGGTVLHSSRTHPGKVKPESVPPFLEIPEGVEPPYDFTPHALKVLEALGIDVLIPIGGDDTLSYGLRLHEEGVPVIAIPKTMDNDVHGTDYCIGFSTAVTRGVQFIQNLRTSTGSHERLAVIELFGRYSGETSLITAYLAGVDRAVISEVPVDINTLAAYLVEDRNANPSNYAMVTISEGAVIEGGEMALSGEEDAYGHRKLGGVGMWTAERIKELTGEGITFQQLGYMMRCGPPDSLDRMVAMNFGNLAMDILLAGRSGVMTALQGGRYTTVGLDTICDGIKRVEVDRFYDVDEYQPLIRQVEDLPMFLK